jgi:hypothetical protein
MGTDLAERFWAKVDRRGDEECWPWTASLNSHGYGQINIRQRPIHAHRVAYELAGGVIPDGLVIDHLCRNRACVNPAHMEIVTRGENVRRGENYWRARTCCKYGHEFTPENTYISQGWRFCRECHRRRSLEYVARKRAMSTSEE